MSFKEFLKADKEELKELVESKIYNNYIDEIFVHNCDDETAERLDESNNWVSGRFNNNIRIDQPPLSFGIRHGHIYGRKDNQIGVVNVDGTSSHGSKFKLHKKDADALRKRDFDIPSNNLIEWVALQDHLRFIRD